MDSFEEHDPLLPTTPTKQKQTTAYFFKPETPSQRSLMDIPPPPKPSCPTVIMMGCCPCAVGDPCSAEKKQEYKKVPKSISIVISLLQVSFHTWRILFIFQFLFLFFSHKFGLNFYQFGHLF